MNSAVRASVVVVAAVAAVTAFQDKPSPTASRLPRFEDFPVPSADIFQGAPATPQLKTPGQRMYRTMIRQATVKGPNFAGRYRVAEWGCGTACKQIVVVDIPTGDVYDGPFGVLPQGVIYLGHNVVQDKTGLFYRRNSSLFTVTGCPNLRNCGTYYYQWTGTQFTLLQQVPMKRLYGSENYESSMIQDVYIDPNGNVQIVYSDGKDFQPPKEKGQAACSSPSVSENKLAAGWLVEKDVCCQSYPIPTTLVVYRPHKPLRKFESGTLIVAWLFLKDGAQVAFHSDRSHGESAPYYGLFDVESGRLIDKWEGELTDKAPAWARWLQ